jgi:quinol monooxygenase YgiN
MLLIQGWLKLATGEFDKVAEQGRAMVAATNAEDGCIHYSFSRDIGDPDLIHIAERWRDAEAVTAHNTSAHMAKFNQAMGGVKIEGADLWLYEAEAVRKLI